MSDLKPFAFVLMPFDKSFDDIYRIGIQATAKDLDVVAERVDEQNFTETILERIYRQIASADFVIADMTGQNPNVFYEVGYAHALGKLCTLITQDAKDIPFDLKHHRHIIYDGSISKLKTALSSEIEWLKEEFGRRKAGVLDIKLNRAIGGLEKSDSYHTGDLTLTIDIHNKTEKRSPEIDLAYFYTGPGWTFSQGTESFPSAPSDVKPFTHRHFIKFPVNRIAPGAWIQLKFHGRKVLWNKFRGDEAKTTYRMNGATMLELVTSEGNIRENFQLKVEFDEFPF